jgi:hypothetical protein
MVELNDQQFAIHTETTGGGSRRLADRELVPDNDPANRGVYAVSHPASMNHEINKPGPVTRDQIRHHAAKMAADPTLASDPATLQGTWKDPVSARVYRDASRLVTPDAGKNNGRRKAVAAGRADKQLAVRDMSRARDVTMSRTDVRLDPAKGQSPATHKVIGNRTMGYTVEPRRKPSVPTTY